MIKTKNIKTLATTANCVELGTSIIRSLSGDTLDGTKMEKLSEIFTHQLSVELKKKGNLSC